MQLFVLRTRPNAKSNFFSSKKFRKKDKMHLIEPEIIFENDSFLVLDKPAGWIVNDASTAKNQPVVQKWLNEKFHYPLTSDKLFRSGIVHRLDKETSGLLLVAKTKESFTNLQLQFQNREVKKTYVALLHGNLEPEKGEIKTTVGRLPWRRERFGVLPGGRESITSYEVTDYYELLNSKKTHLRAYTMCEFYPLTGRTHQIRIHSRFVGHPIVGDEFYAGRKTAREDRVWCPRLFLHAKKIVFEDPLSSTTAIFETDLPSDLKKSLSHLKKL
jgi:23S rRNA pseudouridine1911/1915/1917 synthase